MSDIPYANILRTKLECLREELKLHINQILPQYHQVSKIVLSKKKSGRIEGKLKLLPSELEVYLSEQELRKNLQRTLTILVPLERKIRFLLQTSKKSAISGSLLAPTTLWLVIALKQSPQVIPEVNRILAPYSEIISPSLWDTLMGIRVKRQPQLPADAQDAQKLHAKLLAAGILSSKELVTLRHVMERYFMPR